MSGEVRLVHQMSDSGFDQSDNKQSVSDMMESAKPAVHAIDPWQSWHNHIVVG